MMGARQGDMPTPEAGIKPLHTPADLASLHLSSSTRELSWARLHLASWPLFLASLPETRFSSPLDRGASCTGRRTLDVGCYL